MWNLAVEQQSWWWPGRGGAPGGAERQRQLAQARAAEPWLAEGSSSVQQQALRDFDRALAAFFRPQNRAGRPRYRGKRGPQGFVIRDTRVRRVTRRWGQVPVPKCGWVRFRWTRTLPADLGMARVRVDRAGRWHVAFPAPQPALARRAGGGPVGIDRGVRTALVTSGGQHYRAPRISRQAGSPVPGAAAAAAQAGQGVASGGTRRARAMAQITARSHRPPPRLGGEDLHPPGHRSRRDRAGEAEHPGHGAQAQGQARPVSTRAVSCRTGHGPRPG